MRFLDKIKDLFTDEEEVIETKEIEIDEKEEEEHKLPTFMRNKIEEEEKREKVKKTRTGVSDEIISDREIVKTRTNNNFAFPIEMDELDTFEVPKYSNQNILAKKKEEEKKVSTLYSKKEEPKPKKEEYIIKNIAKALAENIECLMKVKNKFHYLGYFEDERAIGTKIEYLKLQNTILKNIYLILKMRKTMPTKHCLS